MCNFTIAFSNYCENFCEVWLTAVIDDLDCCDMTACWRHVAGARWQQKEGDGGDDGLQEGRRPLSELADTFRQFADAAQGHRGQGTPHHERGQGRGTNFPSFYSPILRQISRFNETEKDSLINMIFKVSLRKQIQFFNFQHFLFECLQLAWLPKNKLHNFFLTSANTNNKQTLFVPKCSVLIQVANCLLAANI